MKLSDAILAGCAITRKRSGDLFNEPRPEIELEDYRLTHTCALGAAYVGLVGCGEAKRHAYSREQDTFTKLQEVFPYLNDSMPVDMPGFSYGDDDIGDWVVRLNDSFGWSRERIAKALAKRSM